MTTKRDTFDETVNSDAGDKIDVTADSDAGDKIDVTNDSDAGDKIDATADSDASDKIDATANSDTGNIDTDNIIDTTPADAATVLENMVEVTPGRLKRRLTSGFIATIIALVAVASATYAWYIYNTGRNTTNVRMAAGAGANLQISNAYNGPYGSAAVLESFSGQLVPVSTNRVTGGFQKVTRFTGGNSQTTEVASSFGKSETNDYYHTSLFLRTNGADTDIYLSGIGYEDSEALKPISTAIRVGLVVHAPGENAQVASEYIFSINPAKNPEARYNTATGRDGYVLDCMKNDGTTLAFTPYNDSNYCLYNKDTGDVILKKDSLKLCSVAGDGKGKNGYATQVEIYIWLEGCDADCTSNLCDQTLKNLAVSFAGIVKEN